MRGRLLLFLAACAVLCGTAQAAGSGAANNYEKYLASIRSAAFHSHFDDRLGESKTFTHALDDDWKIDFVGKRRWAMNKPPIPAPHDPNNRGAHLYSESLMRPDWVCEVEVDPANDTAEVCIAYLETPKDYWETRQPGFGYIAYPFGYINLGKGYVSILSLLRSDDVKDINMKQSGKSVVLTCATPVYEIALTLAPEKNWMPEQIEYKRIAKPTEAYQLTYLKYTVEQSSEHDGIWLPDAFSCEEKQSGGTHRLPDDMRVEIIFGQEIYHREHDKNAPGQRTVERQASSTFAKVVLRDIKLNSVTDDDFRFQAKIPDGLEASMQDARDDAYEWREGKIVAAAKKATVKR